MGADSSRVVTEPGNGTLELFPLDTSATTLVPLCTELFRDHWAAIRFGILIQGSVLEIRAPAAPVTVAMLDGYLTVAFDAWHLHICIDAHHGLDRPVESPARPPPSHRPRRVLPPSRSRCPPGFLGSAAL